MVTPEQIIMIVLGVISCFGGYSLFRATASLWGFILGGWIGYTMLPVFTPPAISGNLMYHIGAFIGGGVIGALIAVPLYFVIIFLSGAALGALFGIMGGALVDMGGITSLRHLPVYINLVFPPLPRTGLQMIMMAVFGLILGGAAISFQKFAVIASSAFLGAAALISGLTGSILLLNLARSSQAAILLMGWFILAMAGILAQYRMMDET
jgi:hypothetical protein